MWNVGVVVVTVFLNGTLLMIAGEFYLGQGVILLAQRCGKWKYFQCVLINDYATAASDSNYSFAVFAGGSVLFQSPYASRFMLCNKLREVTASLILVVYAFLLE